MASAIRVLRPSSFALLLFASTLVGCGSEGDNFDVSSQLGADPVIPRPEQSLVADLKVAEVVGWGDGQSPSVPEGLKVTAYAKDFVNPRTIHTLPNGDVLVVQGRSPKGKPMPRPKDVIRSWIMAYAQGSSGNQKESGIVTLLRDSNRDGTVDDRWELLTKLNSPFGIAWHADTLYVAATDAILAYPYRLDQTEISAAPRALTPLPGGPINHHWTKDLALSPDGRFLYASVGSNSNVAERGLEAEKGRAAIWQVDRETGASRVFGSGLRNPNGLTIHPETGVLWTVVNERDELGPNLAPDYLTSVKEGAFYGWPWSYWGTHVDERVRPRRPDLVEKVVTPDYSLGSHVAALGLAFAMNSALPARYRNGAFVGQHGSWNRSSFVGYKVVFIPFQNGAPSGKPQDVVTGFLDGDQARGRPVGLAIDGTGALLIADDAGNTVWRVAAADGSVTPRPLGSDQVNSPSTASGGPAPQQDAATPAPAAGERSSAPGSGERQSPPQTDFAPATLPDGTAKSAPSTPETKQ